MMFCAFDVETANPDYSSICQIGVSLFDGEKVIDTWKTYIDPEDYFSFINISIHGIDESIVQDAPKFPEIYPRLREMLENKVVVHHMPFDRVALKRVCEKYNLEDFQISWIDTAKVTRRTWKEFSFKGYGLESITNHLGIKFKHHDALEDAIAAGQVFLHACNHTGIAIEEWLKRIYKPIDIDSQAPIKFDGNPDGPLYGETIVFTGALRIPRKEAASLAAKIGCNVGDSVNKSTTMLVVGQQDAKKLKGEDKSSKHRKAEELITKGFQINILSEDDFEKLADFE